MISNTEKQNLPENSNEIRLEESQEKKGVCVCECVCVCVCMCVCVSVNLRDICICGCDFVYKSAWIQEL